MPQTWAADSRFSTKGASNAAAGSSRLTSPVRSPFPAPPPPPRGGRGFVFRRCGCTVVSEILNTPAPARGTGIAWKQRTLIEHRIFRLPVQTLSYPFALVRSGGRGFKNLGRSGWHRPQTVPPHDRKAGEAVAHVQVRHPPGPAGQRPSRSTFADFLTPRPPDGT